MRRQAREQAGSQAEAYRQMTALSPHTPASAAPEDVFDCGIKQDNNNTGAGRHTRTHTHISAADNTVSFPSCVDIYWIVLLSTVSLFSTDPTSLLQSDDPY